MPRCLLFSRFASKFNDPGRISAEKIAQARINFLVSMFGMTKRGSCIKAAWETHKNNRARFSYKSGVVFDLMAPHRVFSRDRHMHELKSVLSWLGVLAAVASASCGSGPHEVSNSTLPNSVHMAVRQRFGRKTRQASSTQRICCDRDRTKCSIPSHRNGTF